MSMNLWDAIDDGDQRGPGPGSGLGSGSQPNQPSWPGQPEGGGDPWSGGGGGPWSGGGRGEGGGPWSGGGGRGEGGGPWSGGGGRGEGGGPWSGGGGGGGGRGGGGGGGGPQSGGPFSGGGGGGPRSGGGSNPVPEPSKKGLSVPYMLNLHDGVSDKKILIEGIIKPNAQKFTVDLFSKKDIAFHFNPRFDENRQQVIVRNSCSNRKWGREERELGRFPFKRGQPFKMKISCTRDGFQVSVDDVDILSFKHRVSDLGSIKRLNICNDLDLTQVHVQ